MNNLFKNKIVKNLLLGLTSTLTFFTMIANAGTLSIHNEPLSTSEGLTVKPNLLFILDDSGSMAWHYSGDYVQSVAMCPNESNGTSLRTCTQGDPLFSTSEVNSQYYDPTIRYYPPNNFDGTAWNNANPAAVILKPFITSGTSVRTVNATTNFQEVYWCKNSSDVPTAASLLANDCVKVNNGETEKYPDATYLYKKTNAYWCRYATDTPPSSNCRVANYDTGSSRFDNDEYNWSHNSTYSHYKTTVSAFPYYYKPISATQWCEYNSTTKVYSNCGPKRTPVRIYPKLEKASPEVIGVRATTSITLANFRYTSGSSSRTFTVSAMNVNGVNLMASTLTKTLAKNVWYNGNTQASDLAAKINAKTAITGFSAVASSNVLTITAPFATTGTNADRNEEFNGDVMSITHNFLSVNSSTFSGGINYSPAITGGIYQKYEIRPDITTYTKYPERTECAAAGCTYAQELQNFANWFQYYKNRMDMMKTATSRVFSEVDETKPGVGFRIGFRRISNPTTGEVEIGEFNDTKKEEFFDELFSALPTSSTPLRAALSSAGRLYGGKHSYDPVIKSCQQNFTFLSTDGYWNTSGESTSYGPYQLNSNTSVGNSDGTTSGESLPIRDASNLSGTLADVSHYYWKTDLRDTLEDNVPTSPTNPANWQHMVTFTLGLGIDGNLSYNKNYITGGSSDYNNLVNGVSGYNWGNPITNTTESRIDDLWHAAVNGRGIYYSAKNPNDIISSVVTTLNSAAAITGSGAAAATSNLEPVAGDNYAYTASYTTKDWIGDLKAQEIDLVTGEIDGGDILWSASEELDAKTMGTRKLYTIDTGLTGYDKKVAMTWENIEDLGFDNDFDPDNLSQCQGALSICSGHTNENLFEYIIGSGSNPNTSYRVRKTLLGDIIHSQPVFVGKPAFAYTENDYDIFAADNADRKGAVYVGANDGFLHAFDAETGEELWAYAPKEVIPNMYKLADNNYYGNHNYYVDGKITVGDVWNGSAWKTILVAGLNYGGKSYFAIDVTDPESPKVLWEYTNSKLGYSYGNPIITKLSDDNWAVLLTSGYNNGAKGQLFVVNPLTGTLKYKIETTASPNDNGIAKIANLSFNSLQNNKTEAVYGGDLDGNVWKFTLGATGGSVYKFATLGQPITTKPVIASVTGSGGATIPAIVVGTGKFLELTDKSDTTIGSVFALKDEGTTTHNGSIKTSSDYVRQTLSLDGTTKRKVTDNSMSWATHSGWWVDFLDPGERVSVDPKLQLGTLVVSTNVPTSVPNSCSAGGYAWINFFNVKNGSFVDNAASNPDETVSTKLGNALVVGVNIVKLPNGKLVSIITTSDNAHPVTTTPTSSGGGGKKRVSWRELMTNN